MASQSSYYGWANLAAAALAMVATLPGRTQGLGLITEPLIADLHVDRVTYATVNLWATLIGALFCLPFGRLTDRLGSRVVLVTIVTGLGATVMAMSRMMDAAALSVTVTLTRGLGQSALSVVSLALVGKWFARRLNYAMGVFSLLVGIGFIVAFPVIGQAVLRFGWRAAWLGVGTLLLVVVAPTAWLVVRDGPSTSTKNVEAVDNTQDLEGLESQPSDLTVWEALQSAAFWVFALTSSLFGLVYSGIALFNQSILEQLGFGASTYYLALTISTMVGLLANFGGGWLALRWSIQRLMGLSMAVLAAALLALPLVRTQTHVVFYALAMGVSGGTVTVLFFCVWGQVFGRSHLGRIQGCAQTMTVVASAVGPLLLAKTLEATGSYDVMFYSLAVAVTVLGICSWWVPLPRRMSRALGTTFPSTAPSTT